MIDLFLKLRELAKAQDNVFRIQHEILCGLGYTFSGETCDALDLIESVTADLGDA